MGASAIVLLVLTALVPSGDGRIVAEWTPGIPEAGLGGELVVDGYGIGGLGAYRIAFDDGTAALAVCIQADIGHSLSSAYVADPSLVLPAELGYLAWAYLGDSPATDVEAAAVNLLAWRYTAAQRSTGGAVWQAEEIEVGVVGVGRLHEVEEAAVRLHAEATARRGPWSFVDATIAGTVSSVRIVGPGGPIAGIPVTFEGDGGWSTVVVTGADGVASAEVPAGSTMVSLRASGPGDAVALLADGSQRLAMAGAPAALVTSLEVPTSTTTTTTSTTVPPTTITTTTVPATTTSTMVPATTSTTTTTTTTSVPTTTTTTPPSPPPPTLPPTGSGSRGVVRAGAALFAVGALAVLCSVRTRPASAGRRRPSSP